nr:hypothetical protein [Tanacetum cinerariifolium]
MIPGSFPQRGG